MAVDTHSMTLTNNAGRVVSVEVLADETVSPETAITNMDIQDGESIVIFTERAKRFSVEIA